MTTVTVTQAGELLGGVSPATVRRYVHEGKLRASRPGNRLLIHRDSIDELLAATQVQPSPAALRAQPLRPSAPPRARVTGPDRVSYRDRVRRARA